MPARQTFNEGLIRSELDDEVLPGKLSTKRFIKPSRSARAQLEFQILQWYAYIMNIKIEDEYNLTGMCPGEPFCEGDCEPFVCMDCNENTLHMGEYYMVHDFVWEYAVFLLGTGGNCMLCIGCLENALGATLDQSFFTAAPINSSDFGRKSDRLMERLGFSPS